MKSVNTTNTNTLENHAWNIIKFCICTSCHIHNRVTVTAVFIVISEIISTGHRATQFMSPGESIWSEGSLEFGPTRKQGELKLYLGDGGNESATYHSRSQVVLTNTRFGCL